MKKFFRSDAGLVCWMAAAFTCLCLTLLTNVGCAKVKPGGAYQNDSPLYNADQTVVSSKQFLDLFVTWERENEALLKGIPAIHKLAEDIRAKAPGWFRQAYVARDAYKADPSQVNSNALDTALRVIKAGMSEALAYFAKYGPQSNPSPPKP